jgi:hypothetical protein
MKESINILERKKWSEKMVRKNGFPKKSVFEITGEQKILATFLQRLVFKAI